MSRNKSVIVSIFLLLILTLSSFVPVAAQDDGLLIWADGQRSQVMLELGRQFTEEFGVPVTVQEMEFGDIRDQLLVAGPVGEGPDILVMPHDFIGQLVANGAIIPIDLGGMEDLFTEASLNGFTYQGQLWGVPYSVENIALIRNTDLVPEAPTTWEEVREIAEQIRAEGSAQYGFLIQTGDTYHHYPVLTGFGGYIFGMTEDGTFDVSDIGFDSEGALEAAEWLEGMYVDGLMVPDLDSDPLRELFAAGELAMWLTGPWFSEDILAADEAGIPVSVDHVPGGVPFSGVQGFAISAFSDNQLLAETFLLDFVATPEAMQALFDADSRPPAFLDVDTSAFPLIDDFVAAGVDAVPMPAIPEMNSVWGAAGDALTLIANGGNGEEAFTNAAVQISNSIQLAASGAVNQVTIAGSLQAAAGCDSDWDPGCEATSLEDQGDGIWSGTFSVPAGEYEYKVTINGDWAENYGAEGQFDGPNIPITVEEDSELTFTYDHNTHLVTVDEG